MSRNLGWGAGNFPLSGKEAGKKLEKGLDG